LQTDGLSPNACGGELSVHFSSPLKTVADGCPREMRATPLLSNQLLYWSSRMKALDRFIQGRRIAQVRPYIKPGARVLDIGCADGVLFRRIAGLGDYTGVDPTLAAPEDRPHFRTFRGTFPEALPDSAPFDTITLLAVLEHIPTAQLRRFANACATHLKPGGYLLVTVPSPLVDRILDVLRWARVIDGMALEEHHGFAEDQTPGIFAAADLDLVRRKRFQFGLNNLFVFRRKTA
jgi:SAM-dependent methyltransferase